MNNELATVIYFWKIEKRSLGFALLHMALDRSALRRMKNVRFAKMLGAGKGETFTPSDADITTWGALVVISNSNIEALDQSRLIKRWRNKSMLKIKNKASH